MGSSLSLTADEHLVHIQVPPVHRMASAAWPRPQHKRRASLMKSSVVTMRRRRRMWMTASWMLWKPA